MLHNACGVVLDTETPVTCVYNGNKINWDYIDFSKAIDPNDDPDGQLWLIGDWKWNKKERVFDVARKNGADGFAAIYNANDNVFQVVWSKARAYGALCSPCYPGQVDSATVKPDGLQKCYVLPAEYLYVAGTDLR